ncbi:HTH domain-containing protein [Niastella caeni]|uniref:HTH domain-containing protein n=1 Tax=Niastella caeni TaxID=2569763 RepID=A0A4S8HRY8_9BACT|nr:HTH domain-containing protein [Niastella caeni]THU38055.1 HTH domain-containing protein [Niastella caeni]
MLPSFVTRLERINHLIQIRATGNPRVLSHRLNISERSLYQYLSLLKEMGVSIDYDRHRETYFYPQGEPFSLRFQKK